MSEEQSKTILQTGLEMASDRIKNNFYGYLITSFVIFNWENIILILKSKNDIEMTLIYISVQPNFAERFLLDPLIYGISASIVMPFISTFYALTIGILTAIRKECGQIGSIIFQGFLNNSISILNQQKLVRGKLAGRVQSLQEEHSTLRQRIETALEQKAKIDTFLLTVARGYARAPELNDEKDLEVIFKTLYNEGLRDFYSKNNIIGNLFDVLEEDNKQLLSEADKEKLQISDHDKG